MDVCLSHNPHGVMSISGMGIWESKCEHLGVSEWGWGTRGITDNPLLIQGEKTESTGFVLALVERCEL